MTCQYLASRKKRKKRYTDPVLREKKNLGSLKTRMKETEIKSQFIGITGLITVLLILCLALEKYVNIYLLSQR